LADRREHRRKVECVLEIYIVPVGRAVVRVAQVILVQVRAVDHPAVREVQDERILIRQGSPA